jgi:methanethiol S-methyltransferase
MVKRLGIQHATFTAGKVAIFLYGLGSYGLFLATALIAIAFIGNFGLTRTMDSAPTASVGRALAVDLLLLTAFALQHSVMARPAFKRWWTRIVPPAAERSTYVLLSNLAILALVAFWEPIGGTVWSVSSPALRTAVYTLYGAGWVGLVAATFCIDHFHLFGLRQVYCHLVGRDCAEKSFRTPGPYRLVRHPIYVCWLTIFWAAPTMTAAHLLFALATTAYILIAIQLEERDLEHTLGKPYARYRRTVPMLIPRLRADRA